LEGSGSTEPFSFFGRVGEATPVVDAVERENASLSGVPEIQGAVVFSVRCT